MQKTLPLLVVGFILLISLLHTAPQRPHPVPYVIPVQPSPAPVFQRVEPVWTHYPAQRQVNEGPVVSDIESHLTPGHPYRSNDRVGWVHEGTHGVNAQLRNTYRKPGFYVLEDRAVLLDEPNTTLSDVANTVPGSLRGKGFNLYLGRAIGSWNRQPSYVFDEWTAYTNGSEARYRLAIQGRSEAVDSMMEFSVYAICVPMASRSTDPQMRGFLMWHLERAVSLQQASGVRAQSLERLRTEADAESLRQFARHYFGSQWTQQVLGF